MFWANLTPFSHQCLACKEFHGNYAKADPLAQDPTTKTNLELPFPVSYDEATADYTQLAVYSTGPPRNATSKTGCACPGGYYSDYDLQCIPCNFGELFEKILKFMQPAGIGIPDKEQLKFIMCPGGPVHKAPVRIFIDTLFPNKFVVPSVWIGQ